MKTFLLALSIVLVSGCGVQRNSEEIEGWVEVLRIANPSETYEFVLFKYNPGAMSSYQYTSRIEKYGYEFTKSDFAADYTVAAPSSLDAENTKWIDDDTLQLGIFEGPVYYSPIFKDIENGKVVKKIQIELHVNRNLMAEQVAGGDAVR